MSFHSSDSQSSVVATFLLQQDRDDSNETACDAAMRTATSLAALESERRYNALAGMSPPLATVIVGLRLLARLTRHTQLI